MSSSDPSLVEGLMPYLEIALVIFMVIFIGIVIWVVSSRSDRFRRDAQIPLDDELVTTPRNASRDVSNLDANTETLESSVAPRLNGNES